MLSLVKKKEIIEMTCQKANMTLYEVDDYYTIGAILSEKVINKFSPTLFRLIKEYEVPDDFEFIRELLEENDFSILDIHQEEEFIEKAPTFYKYDCVFFYGVE